jgi:hypothetical protein
VGASVWRMMRVTVGSLLGSFAAPRITILLTAILTKYLFISLLERALIAPDAGM